MKTYTATVRAQGSIIRTAIAAESPMTARLLLQFLFGPEHVLPVPVLAESPVTHLRWAEDIFINAPVVEQSPRTVPPRTPQQAQLQALKNQKARATQALKVAQQRQKIAKAQSELQAALQPKL